MYLPEPPPTYPLLVSRVIVLALIAGVAAFLTYILTMPPAPPGGTTITTLALIFVAPSLAGAWLLPWLMMRSARRRIARGTWRPSGSELQAASVQLLEASGDVGKLFVLFLTCLIYRMALLEGPALFAATAYMLERQWPSLVLACALLVAMLAHFPTQGRVAAWVDRQLELLQRERELASLDRDARPPRSAN